MQYIKKEYEKQREEAIAEELDVDKITKCKWQKIESVIYGCFSLFGMIILVFLIMQRNLNVYQISKLTWGATIIAILTMVVMYIISSMKYKNLRNDISIEMLEKFLRNRFIVKENEKEIEIEIDNISKYEPEEFIPEEEVEQYLQEMKEIPEEIPKEEVIYKEIVHYFEDYFTVKHFKNFVLEKYGKILDICKIDCSEYINRHRYDYDVYYLKMDVSTKKELHIRESQAHYKNSTFENSIIEFRNFSVSRKKKEIDQAYEKYELTQVQKEMLILLHNKYRLNLKLVIKDGFLMLFSKKLKSATLKNEIKTNYDFVDCIDELVKEFINI